MCQVWSNVSHERRPEFPNQGAAGSDDVGWHVRPRAVEVIDAFLNVTSYQERWPQIPQTELLRTSVRHPFMDTRWILDTKQLASVLQEDNQLILDESGRPPRVLACVDCRIPLCASKPTLPRYALANDNLMPQRPCVFLGANGDLLTEATWLLLAQARAVVIKEVAEPHKPACREEQQKVLKGNTICLPQPNCTVLSSRVLPAPKDVLQSFLREHLSVVFCGQDISALIWAASPRWKSICRTISGQLGS